MVSLTTTPVLPQSRRSDISQINTLFLIDLFPPTSMHSVVAKVQTTLMMILSKMVLQALTKHWNPAERFIGAKTPVKAISYPHARDEVRADFMECSSPCAARKMS